MDEKQKNIDFLQSSEWRQFQQSAGRKTQFIIGAGFSVSIVEHALPIVGKYLYCPRGPVAGQKNGMQELIDLAKKENAGWIRIDPATNDVLESIRENTQEKIVKSPHDMQPREIFVVDITKPEEQLLSEMKPKTRYNIGIAKKKGVKIISCTKNDRTYPEVEKAFLDLTKEMARRQGIVAHPAAYYRKMMETLPPEMLRLYGAEYEGKIIAANLVLFFGESATYLHGASGNEHRSVMAPYLLQWQAILDAKGRGCTRYDFGGVKTTMDNQQTTNGWEGITNFKLGFSPQTKPVVFPGSYDIIMNPMKYAAYSLLQQVKAAAYKLRKF